MLCAPASVRSSKLIRDLVEIIGDQWGLPEDTVESAKLAVAELVGNVARHARTTSHSTVKVFISRAGQKLSVEVHDTSQTVPEQRDAEDDDESGRGLFLIAAVTDDHGYAPTPTGKFGWFEIKSEWPPDQTV